MFLDSIKKYIKDDTIKEYKLRFELFNHDSISFIASVDEFNRINNWYENSNEAIYSINCSCSKGYVTKDSTTEGQLPTLLEGTYIHLNKSTIAKFSYTALTNKTDFLNILATPVPKAISFFRYIKMLVSVPIIFLVYAIYEKYMLGMEAFSSNTAVLNHIWTKTFAIINVISILFIAFNMIFLIFQTCNYSQRFKYIRKNQPAPKLYNYAITNFLIIVVICRCILSVTP